METTHVGNQGLILRLFDGLLQLGLSFAMAVATTSAVISIIAPALAISIGTCLLYAIATANYHC